MPVLLGPVMEQFALSRLHPSQPSRPRALICIIHECDFGSRFCAVWSRVRLVFEVGRSPEAPCIS